MDVIFSAFEMMYCARGDSRCLPRFDGGPPRKFKEAISVVLEDVKRKARLDESNLERNLERHLLRSFRFGGPSKISLSHDCTVIRASDRKR